MYKRFLLILCVLVTMIAPVSAQDSPTEITVFMPFVPNIQFAPVYVALEKGYFTDAGLEVTLEYGSEPDGLERLAVGDVDYAFVGGEQIIIARANERPVVYVYEWYQRNPIAIVIPTQDDETAIETPADLAGETVGVPGRFGATYSSLVALLQAADLTEDDIDLQEIGFNAPEVVCVGGVEAAAVYINNEPLQIRNRALAGDCGDITGVEVIAVADYADLVSNGIAVSEDKRNNNPDEVTAFVSVFEQAMQDTLRNPLEAYQLSTAHIDNLPYESDVVFNDLIASTEIFLESDPTPAELADRREFLIPQTRTVLTSEEWLQLEVLLATIDLWEADILGQTDPASWEVTQEALLAIGFIEQGIDLDDAYTNTFVPGA